MYTPIRRQEKSHVKEIVFIVVLVLIILAGAGIAAYYFFQPKQEVDKATLCPKTNGNIQPFGNVVILIDETDPLTENQKDFINVEINNIVRQQSPGTMISVYFISQSEPIQRKPAFSLCKVRDGGDANTLTENGNLLKKRFQRNFEEPLRKALQQLKLVTVPSRESRLFEQLQSISVNSFQKYHTEGPQELYIFSDMLHNSKEYSLYSSKQDFKQFKKTAYFAGIRTKLMGVDVTLFYLTNQPKFQTNKNVNFWKAYFNDAGASIVKVDPVGK